ncbi:MAG TPA: hypothetical protein VG034_16170, partial [Acidimicrobiia bacterium]|nr:hypothetical protein [Acidimicrobiia bacterium]
GGFLPLFLSLLFLLFLPFLPELPLPEPLSVPPELLSPLLAPDPVVSQFWSAPELPEPDEEPEPEPEPELPAAGEEPELPEAGEEPELPAAGVEPELLLLLDGAPELSELA